MSLKTRIKSLEKKWRTLRAPELHVVEVPYFEPGPDVEPGRPVFIIVRDPEGRERKLGSLREFYIATAIQTGYGESCH